ncbi:Mobile element protein [Candidatus Enterovibrio altilux]|uniref:Mobile element protein n=1 Tax=Candidatus Enterovibrio altilux TaxID=1927128 RepID=A0A291BBH9_9GAMM|nr:Mobile element protein [Candidatus Enterovibrio luxaltus]
MQTRYNYYKRSLSETTMFRVNKFLERTLCLRNHNTPSSETYAMIKVLNTLTELCMPKIKENV